MISRRSTRTGTSRFGWGRLLVAASMLVILLAGGLASADGRKLCWTRPGATQTSTRQDTQVPKTICTPFAVPNPECVKRPESC